jgi:DNA polymerase III delta subunit
MTVNELKNKIARGSIENIYLFGGPEIGEKNEAVSMIVKQIFGESKPVIYNFYCANEFDPVDFIDTMNTNLLFSDKKIIVLKNIEQANKSLIKLLEDLIVPNTIISVNYENKFHKKISNALKEKEFLAFYEKDENGNYHQKSGIKDSDIKKIAAFFSAHGISNIDRDTILIMLNESNDKIPAGIINLLNADQYIIFWEMFDSQKPGWVRNEFKKYNLFIEDSAVEFVLDMVENNKYFLENEIQKIAVSFQDLKKSEKNVVTREIIEEYIYHSKEETSFTLYSAMLEKNLAKSLEIAGKIFYSEDESLINGILWSHRRFLRALDLFHNQNKSIEEVFSLLQVTTKKGKEELAAGLKIFDYYHVSLMYYYLSELDYYMKILPDELKLVKLQEFIINFILGDIKQSFLQGDLIHSQSTNII